MMKVNYLASILAIAYSVIAQDGDECEGPTTVQNAGDASALAGCQTFTGDIVIETGTTDNLAFDGIELIEGSLRAVNVSELTQISSSTLQRITEEFELDELQVLSTLNFPQLSEVETIRWNALAALQALTFDTEVQNAATVDIQNTGLASLTGITLDSVDNLIITNNPFLKEISLSLGNVSEALTLEGNAQDLVVDFPELIWAVNMTLRNCSEISVPQLATINGSFGIYGGAFESFAAPELESVGEALSVVDNVELSNVSFPVLTDIGGGFTIANNTNLDSIEVPELETVGGAIDFTGNFSEVDLPALQTVRGAFNLQSSEDLTDVCDGFEQITGRDDVIQGDFTCVGNEDNPDNLDEDGDGDDDGDDDGDGEPDAAGHINVSAAFVMCLAGMVAAFMAL